MAKPLETMTASIKTKTVKINAITASMKAHTNELKKLFLTNYYT
jgi:hypothetical protein